MLLIDIYIGSWGLKKHEKDLFVIYKVCRVCSLPFSGCGMG